MGHRESFNVNSHFLPMKGRPWLLVLFTGGLAYVVGYTLMVILLVIEPERDLDLSGAGGPGPVAHAGWMFYNSHFVGFSDGLTFFGESTHSLFEIPLTIPVVIYLAVPVVVLMLAGFLIVNWQAPRQTSLPDAATSGGKAVIGYGLLALVGVFVISIPPFGPPIIPHEHPNVGETILFMCLTYPLIFGGFGGVIAAFWHTRLKQRI